MNEINVDCNNAKRTEEATNSSAMPPISTRRRAVKGKPRTVSLGEVGLRLATGLQNRWRNSRRQNRRRWDRRRRDDLRRDDLRRGNRRGSSWRGPIQLLGDDTVKTPDGSEADRSSDVPRISRVVPDSGKVERPVFTTSAKRSAERWSLDAAGPPHPFRQPPLIGHVRVSIHERGPAGPP